MPKKIQLALSQAKWQLSSSKSVLVLVGLQNLRMQQGIQDSSLMANLIQVTNKAKALDIPIVDLYGDDLMQGMQQLGEYASTHPQLIFAGQVTPMLKQILPHLMRIHHLNTYSLTRLWELSAPSEYVLSTKGIMLAIAEQLDMDALEIDPYVDLKNYGLDSVAMVSLVGVWRAHGANIRYEDVLKHPSLHKLASFILQSLG